MDLFKERNIIVGLILLQAAVCLPFINSFPIALDEPFSIFWAQQDLGQMISVLNDGNNSPLHFITLHFWIKLFGISPFSVRTLSLLFSLLTIPVIYFLGRKMVKTEFAVFFVLIFIFSRFNHYHAMEARMYSLFVLLFSLTMLLSYKWIFEKKTAIIQLSVINALLFYTHYLGLVVFSVEIFILLFFSVKTGRSGFLNVLYLVGLSMILMLPGLFIFIERFFEFSESGTWVPSPQFSELYGNIIRFFNNTLTFLFIALTLVGVFIFRYRKSIASFFNKLDFKFYFVALFFVLPYFGMFIFSRLLDSVFLDRYLLFTTIPLYLLVAVFSSFILDGKIKMLVLACFVLLLIVSVKIIPNNNREPHKLALEVKNMVTENFIIAISPPYYDLTFAYHYNRSLFQSYENFKSSLAENRIFGIYNFHEIKTPNDYDQIIFVDDNSNFVYPENNIFNELLIWGELQKETSFKGGAVVYSFVKR